MRITIMYMHRNKNKFVGVYSSIYFAIGSKYQLYTQKHYRFGILRLLITVRKSPTLRLLTQAIWGTLQGTQTNTTEDTLYFRLRSRISIGKCRL